MKKAISIVLTLVMVLALCTPAFAANVVLSPQNLTVDGKAVTCEKYNIGGANYFKLRDLAQALSGTSSQFEVGWDGATGTVSITTGKAYTSVGGELSAGADKSSTAQVSKQTIQINGVTRSDLSAYNIGGANFFKLRDLGTALGFDVDFDSASNTAVVKSGASTVQGEDDYARAFQQGYVDSTWAARSKTAQVRSTEYKALLTAMITKLAPDKLSYFNTKVTDYDLKMTRGMAAVMSWYAAVCIGVDDYNNGFEGSNTGDDDGFWYKDDKIYVPLFPDCIDKSHPVTVGRDTWSTEFDGSMLWNVWHSSPVSNLQTVAWDYEAGSLHAQAPFTVENAVCALARLNDSYLETILVPITSAEATGNTISTALLQKAAASKITSIDQLPRLTGFVLRFAYDFDARGILATARDIRNTADWGFTSARIPVRYEALFSEDCSKVRPIELERLDDLIEASIQSGIHANIDLVTLPGRTVWLDAGYKSGGDFDLFINAEKQKQAIQVWQYLAERYKDVPGEYLSFTPIYEATNPSLATGAAAPEYSAEDVAKVLDRLIAAIREKDEDRFIIYEPTSDNGVESILRLSRPSFERISAKYDNVRISYNFCEQPYVYYNM